ncbi:hypothetical protein PAAG_08060 [Paracoccidioides lutzii Pb01]|uniref:Uncharacterized protein n=1 Tax=Paracoccidioides lutzii (strain ATCC MYA-826 / Pb01) TaxID=502779 RepID=C1HBB9_PARBA|nr:hypothetical protein PAAG_08060 [Paracoccidioides lutzii Pb01]EEH37642.2 hypothetical protein PAAG_08060 [Paracoccidioides lutzii Pb01]
MESSARTPRSARRGMESGAIIKNTPRPSNPRLTRPKKRSILNTCKIPLQPHFPPKKDTLNNKLLLSIQSACNSLAIKLPWQEIAALMGGSISDSAIVQHLTKLRARMEESGASVPPPLKRGVGFFRTGRGTSDGTASATATASCSSRLKGGRGTAPSSTKVKVEVGENEEWNDDSSDNEREDDDRAGASSFKRNEIDEDNRSDHDNGKYVSAGASFLHFPVDAGLASYYSSRKAESHATLSAFASVSACSGTSPRLKSKIVKVGTRGVTGQGIGGNRGGLGGGAANSTTVDVLGQKFSGHNISSASIQTVYSPDGSADLQVDAGGNSQPAIGESTVTTGHLPHQYQYGWTESTRGTQYSPAVDGLRHGGQGRYGNHNTSHGAGYQQHTSPFNMASNIGIPHHGTTTNPSLPSGYQETGNRFQNSDMPPPPAPQHNNPISPRHPHHYVDGMGMGAFENIAGGLWHNNTHPHPHTYRPSPNNPTHHTDPFVRRETSSASIITSTTTANTGTEADTITPAILEQLPSMQVLNGFGGSLADTLLDDGDDMFAPLREAWVDGSW